MSKALVKALLPSAYCYYARGDGFRVVDSCARVTHVTDDQVWLDHFYLTGWLPTAALAWANALARLKEVRPYAASAGSP